MEITGKIIAVLEERGGTSQRTGAEWKLATYVLETSEQYPHKMCFEVFGSDRIQSFNIQLGETLLVRFDIDAHEYNGRWYNSIRAFGVSRDVSSVPVTPPAVDAPPFGTAPAPAQSASSEAFPSTSGDSDLPF